MSELPTIVAGIPGAWADRTAVVESIAAQSGGYLFAERILMHIETKWSCGVEIYEHDPNMRRAFEAAGSGRISEDDLSAIDAHSRTLYLTCDGGSAGNARSLAHAANAILQCGGLGVKIESAGIAHSPERWREQTNFEPSVAMLYAFVTYAGDNGSYYSCGMHNIGHRDVVVTGEISAQHATDLLFGFNSYVACEHALIADGETFSLNADSPRFRVHKQDCTEFSPDDLFHNPYGVYSLSYTETNPE